MGGGERIIPTGRPRCFGREGEEREEGGDGTTPQHPKHTGVVHHRDRSPGPITGTSSSCSVTLTGSPPRFLRRGSLSAQVGGKWASRCRFRTLTTTAGSGTENCYMSFEFARIGFYRVRRLINSVISK